MTSFRRNLGVATLASIVSFALSLLLTPVMTRIYAPEDYGVFSVINNLATFLAMLFSLSLPNAIPLEVAPHKRLQIVKSLQQLMIAAFVSTLAAVLVYLAVRHIEGGVQPLTWSLLVLPILTIAITAQRTGQGLANASGSFKSMAAARVAHPSIAKPGAIAAGILLGPSAIYMLMFEALGYFVQTLILVKRPWWKFVQSVAPFSMRRLRVTAGVVTRNKDLSLYGNLSSLAVLGSASAQALIVAGCFSIREAGIFALALAMASLPVQLIALATASVVYHQLIRLGRENPHALAKAVLRIGLVYLALGLPVYTTVLLFGPKLFGFAFGQEWAESGAVASLLAFPFLVHFVLTPLISVFRVVNRVKLNFVLDVTLLGAGIALFLVACLNLDFQRAVMVLAAVISVHRVLVLAACVHVARRRSAGVEGGAV